MGLGITFSELHQCVSSRGCTENPGFVICYAALLCASVAAFYKRRINPMGDESRVII